MGRMQGSQGSSVRDGSRAQSVRKDGEVVGELPDDYKSKFYVLELDDDYVDNDFKIYFDKPSLMEHIT